MKIRLIVALGVFISLASAIAASADPAITVTFPEKGGYFYWIEHENADGIVQTTAPGRISGEKATVDLAPAAMGDNLAPGRLKIYDQKTGNLASKSLENLEGKKELKLKSADFDLVRKTRLILRPPDAKPDERVESAVVKLKDANSDVFASVVVPSSEGVAEFYDIAAGQENVTISYEGKNLTLDIEIPADRDDIVFSKAITLPEKTRTVKVGEPVGASQASKPDSKAKTSGPSPASIVQIFLSFIMLAFIGFIGYVVLKSRGVTLKDSMKRMGVEFPAATEESAPAETASDPNICPFCGQKKDPASGNCACSVTPRAASSGPRLIGTQGAYAGHIFEITIEGGAIGRDAGNTIPLVNDSTASRVHARVSGQGGAFFLTDEGSSNGTFVNGARITGQQQLRPGDEVQIGSTKFRFEG